jgi:hypothetical protein
VNFEREQGGHSGNRLQTIFRLSMTDIDLNLLARQNERVLTELRGLRDDMRVLTVMAQRHDHSLAAVLEELRAIHQWINGLDEEGVGT